MSTQEQAYDLGTSTPWNTVAHGYSVTTQESLTPYARHALNWAQLSDQDHVLDVACGPGTLTLLAAQTAKSVHGVDFAPHMIDILNTRIKEQQLDHVTAQVADGQHLEHIADAQFDAAFSMFGLMFFPERARGFDEIFRTLKPGGRIAVSSWGPISSSPFMQFGFEVLSQSGVEIPELPRTVASIDNPELFTQELHQSGFERIEITPIDCAFAKLTPEHVWRGFELGFVHVAVLKTQLSKDEWAVYRKRALTYLEERLPQLPEELTSQALLGTAYKPLT